MILVPLSEESYREISGKFAGMNQPQRINGNTNMLDCTDIVFVRENQRTLEATVDGGSVQDAARLGLWYKFLAMVMWKLHKREVRITLGDVKAMMHEYAPSLPAIVVIENPEELTVKLTTQRKVEREAHAAAVRGNLRATESPQQQQG